MSNVVQFNFEKTYKEIEIGDKIYKMEMNDEAQERAAVSYKKVKEFTHKYSQEKIEAMDEELLTDIAKDQKQFAVEMVDSFLGGGTGEELYELAGRSSVNLMKLVRELMAMFEEFAGASYEDEKKKFTKKAK